MVWHVLLAPHSTRAACSFGTSDHVPGVLLSRDSSRRSGSSLYAELHPVFRSRCDSNSFKGRVLWRQRPPCRHLLWACRCSSSSCLVCSLPGGPAGRYAARQRGPSPTTPPISCGRRAPMPAPGSTASASQQPASRTLYWGRMPGARPASASSRARGPGNQSRRAISPSALRVLPSEVPFGVLGTHQGAEFLHSPCRDCHRGPVCSARSPIGAGCVSLAITA